MNTNKYIYIGRTSDGGTGFPIQVASAQFHNTHPKTGTLY